MLINLSLIQLAAKITADTSHPDDTNLHLLRAPSG
jgi:hypothetical protein